MGLFDPNAEVRTGFTPCREHLRIVNAEVKVCKSNRDSINFEFKTDADKTRYKTVTVNSIFSSVIKGMMLGVGLNPENFGEANLREIAEAFYGKDGEAWTAIPKDKEYPVPQYFFPKGAPSMPNHAPKSDAFADGSSPDDYQPSAPEPEMGF
jgi:hypothetical protein